MDLTTVFEAAPKTTWEIMCQPGAGFYIPAYQRDYAWDKEKVQRLIADCLHGLQLLVEKNDSITFIGTLIVLNDVKAQAVNPVVRGDLPTKVLLVIDGQQRLTTLALLNTVLHEELSRRVKEKEFQAGDRPAFAWLRDMTSVVLAQLDLTFRLDMTYGELKHYPRLIRGLVDVWSRKEAEAKYRSSVAACLFAYLRYADGGGGRKFEYKMPDGTPDEEATGHEVVGKNRETLRKEVLGIAAGGEEETEFPPLEAVAGKEEFQVALLKAPLPAEVVAQLTGGGGTEKEREKFAELLRLVLFSKFMMDRVAVTMVLAKNEDYAFDMFEALNTTGEPLTAFETFRPKVIEAEGLAKYDASPSHACLKAVEGYVGQYAKARDRHAATTNLLLPFALAETGKKLAKRLTEQRKYLRGGFDDLPDLPTRREFVRHLAHTADFLCHLWPDDKGKEPELDGDEFAADDLTLLCLDALRAANHHIPVGLLSRFYARYREADSGGKEAARAELEEAIRAVAAFFVLWRGSRRTTANIDAHYRRVLSDGIEGAGVKAFARRPEKGKEAEVPTADRLRAAFRHVLAKGNSDTDVKIGGKQDWVNLVPQIDVFKQSGALARLMLFLATHDTVPDANHPGLVCKGRPGSLNMFTLDRWRDDLTLEHIAPQSKNSAGWEKGLYEDTDLVNSLGNLTLSPGPENASLGKRAWAAKRVMYQVLGTASLAELNTRLAAAKAGGIEFASSTEKILEKAAYLPHLAAVAEVPGEWTPELVKLRSARLAELAWDRIAPWLGLS